VKPIFLVHAGEYLVATYIEEHFKDLNVWVPSKDTGVDLLVTNKTNSRSVSIQVKFSKDFLGSKGKSTSMAVREGVKAGGWWKFQRDKLIHSAADLWILVLYRFSQRDYDFVIITPQELWQRYDTLGRTQDYIQSYVWVTTKERCWESRDLNKQQQDEVAADEHTNSVRDLTAYLNNWEAVEAKLS
jgi:hypothetical protein